MSNVIDLNRIKKDRPTTKPTKVSEDYDFNDVIERNKQRDKVVSDERKRNNRSTKRSYLRRDD